MRTAPSHKRLPKKRLSLVYARMSLHHYLGNPSSAQPKNRKHLIASLTVQQSTIKSRAATCMFKEDALGCQPSHTGKHTATSLQQLLE